MTSSRYTIRFIRHMTKILLSIVVLKSVTVAAITIKGHFMLLNGESDDLLYYEKSHHQWHLCNINHTEVNLYEYNKNGYISVDCYLRNYMYKKTGNLKYAIFMTGSGDKRLGPPMCPPLKSGESYDWRCEKDMLSSAVTPYRNCTSVCKEGFYTVNHVTVRCNFMLDWIWFGDDTTPRCDSGSPSTKVTPSNPNGPVYIPTTILTTDFNWILKNLTSLPLNSTSTRLTWMVSPLHNENPFPRRYRLSYRVRGETTHKEIILNGSSVNHTLTNLQKETDYDIELCALGNQDKKKFCINTTTHINADKPVTQHSETNSKVYAGIIGGSIAGGTLICIAVILAMYCYCKKNRSRGPYIAVPGHLSSSSSRCSQCSPGRYSCCLQVLTGNISLDNGPTEGASESTDTGTSSYEDKNENNNGSSYTMDRENVILVSGKDTDKEKKRVDSGRKMCPISENNKEQLENLSSELSKNKNSEKTDENEKQLNDLSSELSEIERSVKNVETQIAEENKQELLLSDKKGDSLTRESMPSLSSLIDESSGYASTMQNDLSSELSEIESSVKTVETQIAEENKQELLLSDKKGNSLTRESMPSLSSLIDESSGYASTMQTTSVDLTRHDNCHEDTDNVGNNMDAMEHRPGPSSIQEYRDDQVNQLLYDAQRVYSIVKPDSFDFNRPQDKSLNQYCSIGQEACEQESNCRQQFPLLQRSSSPSDNTLSDPGQDGGSQSSTYADILQNQGTFPTEEGAGANITNTHIASTMCTLSVETAKEVLSPVFFQTLAYQLDPDSFYGNAKSWYGLTRVVLHWSEEKVKSIRHHTMGNIERGHFHETLVAYTAEHKFMSDIVKYFVQPSSLRPDVIQFIKQYHTDCPVCNALYPQVDISMSQSTQEIIKISTDHHENNS